MTSSREWSRISPEDKSVVQKYFGEIPVKLGGMAKELGIVVKKSPTLPRSISGQIKRLESGMYEIKINKYESLARQRFTLAHEISHFLLHRNEINKLGEIADNVLYRSGASETIEYEANRLAAQIIMPEEAISERQQAIGNNIDENIVDQLAKEFGVSKAVMEIRIAAAEAAE
ncbi:MAG: hypothetical protein [Caudoviricetes sp.]|nr:MAG: hypothetical protein [Caudoviricetes sp.]